MIITLSIIIYFNNDISPYKEALFYLTNRCVLILFDITIKTWNGLCIRRTDSVMPVSNKRIVSIVDDDLDIVELFCDALRSIKGVVVFKFTNPLMALEHIKINKDAYVLLISDLRMPGLDGLELIKRTKKLNHNIRTLLMTAFDLDDNLFREYTRREIINGFLQKPIKIGELRLEANKQIHAHEIYV